MYICSHIMGHWGHNGGIIDALQSRMWIYWDIKVLGIEIMDLSIELAMVGNVMGV